MLARVMSVLDRIYRKHTFVGIALHEELSKDKSDAEVITATVYGVLEHDATLNFYLERLCVKRPKPVIQIVLKIGLFRLLYSDTPEYAAVSETVNLAKEIGKGAQSGFINATCRAARGVVPPTDGDLRLSFDSGRPLWWIAGVKKDYPNHWHSVIFARPTTDTHLRLRADFAAGVGRKTPFGIFVTAKEREVLDRKHSGKKPYCVQSLGSCYVASAVPAKKGERVLDACAAPGGKAIFIHERTGAQVTACDIYPHRIELIEKNARSHGLKADAVIAKKADATERILEFVSGFRHVLVDAPCSGSGVVWSKPDILLEEASLSSLTQLQERILLNVADYVQPGGTLVYATCSLFRAENDDIVAKLLAARSDFSVEMLPFQNPGIATKYGVQFLPVASETEGFYVSRMRREG